MEADEILSPAKMTLLRRVINIIIANINAPSCDAVFCLIALIAYPIIQYFYGFLINLF